MKQLIRTTALTRGVMASSALVAATLIAAQPGAAIAQQASAEPEVTEVGEVVVTARRREERLNDVPVAATVLGADALAARGGVTSALDLTAGQPAVRFFNTTSPVNSEISIRASPTARATSSDPSVGLYRNGAYIGGGAVGGRSFTRMDLFDIGQVEILRGTQGALYGRNAVGGAANVISARPVFQDTGWVDVRYAAENENRQVQGVANFALSDSVALRLGLDWTDQSGGFFYNPFNDVYFDHQESIGARAQLRWRGASTDVNLMVERMESDIPAITYQVYIEPSAFFPHGYIQNPYVYDWNTAPVATQDLSSIMLNIDHDFSWGRLSSTTMVRERTSFYQFDADGTNPVELAGNQAAGLVLIPIDANQAALADDKTRIISQDIHISGDAAEGRVSWLAGAEWLDLKSDSGYVVTRTPTLANPSTGTFSPTTLEYQSWAVYGALGYDVTERFNLSLEARYTSDDKRMSSRRFDRGTGLPIGGPGFVVDAETQPDNVSYNLIGAWRLTPDVLGYAKMGSSYRAGGFNANLGNPLQPIPIPAAYDDESATSYEIGLKGQLPSGLRFGLAAYRTETDDLIVQTDNGCRITHPTCTVAATSFLTNAGKAESWGVELELSGRYALGGGTFTFNAGVSTQGGEVKTGFYAGEDLAQVPDLILGLDLNWRRRIGGDRTVFTNVNYAGQRGGNQELVLPGSGTPQYPLADMDLINARFGVDFGGLELSAFVTNLTDESYEIFASPTTRRLNQPRNFGFQLRKRW